MLSAEYLFAIGLRSGLALLFGVLFGIAALLLFFFVLPGLYTPPMWTLVFVTGAGSSVAGFLAYLKPETNWKIIATGFLFAMGGGEGVLRMGSFSKIIATGLRSGWVEAAPRYTEALARVRFDMGNNPLIQRALTRYVDSGALEPHVKNMRDLYRQKCDALANSLEEFCEPYVRFNRPEGGFFLWVECIGVGAMELTQTAAREGLMFPAGAFFYRDGAEADDSHVRLAFSNAPIEELQQAGQRMRDVFQMLVD